MAYANILGYVKKWVILVNKWVGYIRYIAYISRVIRDKSYEEVLVVMIEVYQIVDKEGKVVNDYIYTSLKEALEHRDNLMDNYDEMYRVKLLSLYGYKKVK